MPAFAAGRLTNGVSLRRWRVRTLQCRLPRRAVISAMTFAERGDP